MTVTSRCLGDQPTSHCDDIYCVGLTKIVSVRPNAHRWCAKCPQADGRAAASRWKSDWHCLCSTTVHMRMNKLKIFLVAGTLGIAVTTITPVSAATTMSTGTTASQRAVVRQQTLASRQQAAAQTKQLNLQFLQQRKQLKSELNGASAEEKASIREQLKQLNEEHNAQLRQIKQNLRTDTHTLQQQTRTRPTTNP